MLISQNQNLPLEIQDKIQELKRLETSTYIEEQLKTNLEAWERKEYLAVQADNKVKAAKLRQHLEMLQDMFNYKIFN